MAGNLAPVIKHQFFDTNGDPLAGGKLYSYQAGTSTPQATYTSQSLGTPNANPVVLDASGMCNLWLNPSFSYKFLMQNSLSVEQWSVDNIIGTLTNDAVNTAALQDRAVTAIKIATENVKIEHLASQAYGPTSLLNYGLAAAVGSNALTITLNDGAGTAPSASSPVKVLFRSTTATTGVPVARSITSALTGTVSSGSTLGSVSGKANWIYVYLADDNTTRQLAFTASKMWDEGLLHSITIEGGAGGADSKTTLYGNAAMTGAAIRLIGRIKSTQATAGTWVTAPSEISLFPFEQHAPRSEVWLYDGNNYGAVNTVIRRWVTTGRNVGSAITYADDADAGASFTINEDGLYSVSFSDNFNAGSSMGISQNSTQLTTGIAGINQADVAFATTAPATNQSGSCGGVLFLKAGDVLRAHTDGSPQGTSTSLMIFRITKVSD